MAHVRRAARQGRWRRYDVFLAALDSLSVANALPHRATSP